MPGLKLMRSDVAMKHKLALRIGTFFLIGFITLTLWGNTQLSVKAEDGFQDIPWVDPALLAKSKTSEPLDFLIYFEEQADLSGADGMSWEARGWFVYETLTALAEASQAEVRAYLDTQNAPYEAFWVQNVIAVQSSTAETLTGLLNYGEIESLQSIPQIYLEEGFLAEGDESDPVTVAGISGNLAQINADEVWSLGNMGEGVVVGSIDTGARFTHEALMSSYRGNLGEGDFSHHYHWWDAVNHQDEPYDDHGHGSHVTGIMTGAKAPGEEIGVAPGADWIACKAISATGRAWGHDLIKCGQFMAAPTNLSGLNPNPNLRPQVVNNSWGDCGRAYNPWYQGVIDAWLAAGIYPVFANGNASNCGYASPPGLNTVGNPARAYNVTSVGSTGMADGQYAQHSNWGPTDSLDTLNAKGYPAIKPQVVAPGVSIRSAVGFGDSAYASWSGTSMSAPHVAGMVALMWGSADCLRGDYVTTETLILETARPIPYDTGNGDEGPGQVPNYATGWGEIDALAAVTAAQAYCEGGFLEGYVRNIDDQAPIPGVVIEAVSQGDPAWVTTTVTDEAGYYRIFVNSDTSYTLTASIYGYHRVSVSDVRLGAAGETTTTHFNLKTKSNFVAVTGVVTDGGGHGYPLYARVTIENGDHSEVVYSNPFDGTYQFMVYDDEVYDLQVTALVPGYQPYLESGVTYEHPFEPWQHALEITYACDAPGYLLVNTLTQAFDGRNLPSGWEVWDTAGTGVSWGFDNHSERGNLTGGSGSFAIVDSDYSGPLDVDTSLVSPSMDFSGEPTVMLSFDQDFFFYPGNQDEVADVDVSIAGGDWQTVLRQTESVRGPGYQSIDISDLAAHQGDVRVRFRYYNAHSEWWWQVDNVHLGSHACALVEGGVLAGFITDKHSGAPLVGALVSNEQSRVMSTATPLDPDFPDGFYWSFQPMTENPQVVSVKAAKSLYFSATAEVEMGRDTVTRLDMDLVSYLNQLGLIFNNLLALIWEFLQGVFWLAQTWIGGK
jgi:subtilisin family serine protease